MSLFCAPIIESKEAIENVEAIVGVDGIDAAVIGPFDLSISLGVFKQFDHADYLKAIDRVRAACHKFRKAMGYGCYSLEHAKSCAAQGDTLLLIGGDDVYLAAEARRWLDALK
jgi:2-keto-3-deoxy-L-rhamnonate aldolase RhmA